MGHEDQIVVIKEQKAEKLRQIETEEAVQLDILRQSREECALEGDGREETCREEHDRILDNIRTERDAQLEAVRVQSGEAQLEAIAEAKEELVLTQAQLEQRLKNIREQRFDEIEKIMRKCEGGAEEACPVFDCSMCEGHNGTSHEDHDHADHADHDHADLDHADHGHGNTTDHQG